VVLFAVAFHLYRLFDFRIFFEASHRLLAGKDLYPSRAQLYARTRDYYVLPPVVAFLCVPLSHLPFVLAGSIYALGMTAALAASLRICGVGIVYLTHPTPRFSLPSAWQADVSGKLICRRRRSYGQEIRPID
jgi:hypothetical protein